MSYRCHDWSEGAKVTDLITSTCESGEVEKTSTNKLQEYDMK